MSQKAVYTEINEDVEDSGEENSKERVSRDYVMVICYDVKEEAERRDLLMQMLFNEC